MLLNMNCLRWKREHVYVMLSGDLSKHVPKTRLSTVISLNQVSRRPRRCQKLSWTSKQ